MMWRKSITFAIEMKVWLTQLRVSHWVKNLYLFVPAFFAGALTEQLLPDLAVALACFCLVASSIYIINDLLDRGVDKAHNLKSMRPIAAGKIAGNTGVVVAVFLAASGLGLGWWLGQTFFLILLSYLVMNLLYSAGLKNIFLLDITLIAVGFLLRVFAGGVVADVPISDWLIVMVFLLSLFIALAKRRDDAELYEKDGILARKNIKSYNLRFIDTALAVMASVIVVAYIMYSMTEEVVERAGSQYVFVTSGFVVLGVIKYLHRSITEGKTGSPIKVLFQDRFIQALVFCWLLTFYLLLYVI